MIQRLFQPIDIASLAFFRIVFGILAFADVMAVWTYYHLYMDDFSSEKFQFKYTGFAWVTPLPEPFFSLYCLSLLAAAIGIALGKCYRYVTVYFFVGITYLFLLEKAHYLNHGYLFCWLSFVMIFLPANREWSLDVYRDPGLRRATIPFWSMAILPCLMGIVYFYGGIAKINIDWLDAMPLLIWLEQQKDLFLLGDLFSYDWMAYLLSYGGLILDLFVVFFLLFKRTRIWAMGFVILFHLTNMILFQIGIFPWLSTALTLLFFPPDLPRRWARRLTPRWEAAWQERVAGHSGRSWHDATTYRPFILGALSLLLLFHTLFPLRHHFLEGPVAWTEEGHRFSWRMMLRSKVGSGMFTVVEPDTGKKNRVKIGDYLSPKQQRKLFTHPDMILEFAHFLHDQYAAKGMEDVEIYADIKVRLNGHERQRFIDPAVDLARVEWSAFRHSEWIIPLEADLSLFKHKKRAVVIPENE